MHLPQNLQSTVYMNISKSTCLPYSMNTFTMLSSSQSAADMLHPCSLDLLG